MGGAFLYALGGLIAWVLPVPCSLGILHQYLNQCFRLREEWRVATFQAVHLGPGHIRHCCESGIAQSCSVSI